jgi:hypothetical protein
VVLVAALVVTAISADDTVLTVATIAAVVAGWVAVSSVARRWTIGPWGAVAAAAAACGILLVRDPGYRVLGILFVAVGLIALPVLLAVARVKRYADRLPDAPTRTDTAGDNWSDSGTGLFD